MSKTKVILITLIMSQFVIADISNAAVKLYHECASESMDKNIIISPFSISSAMASLSMGAGGQTLTEIVKGMYLNPRKNANAEKFSRHLDALDAGRGDSTLSIVNQIYAQKEYEIKNLFRNRTVNYFKSGIESIDFADSEKAANAINSFVANRTNNKIQNLIGPDALDSSTGLVLINAIHFKAHWEHEFENSQMYQGDFHVSQNETKSVKFMKDNQHMIRYTELKKLNAKAIELKFENSNFAFIALLPDDPNGLSKLEEDVQTMNLKGLLGKMNLKCVEVSLPKFKIEYEVDLQNVLKKLGITRMFEDSANFSGIFKSIVPMKVSKVLHKAFIDVNEHGTEAAAATSIGLGVRSGFMDCPRVTAHFKADHPFIFHIMDVEENITIFSGRLMNPSQD